MYIYLNMSKQMNDDTRDSMVCFYFYISSSLSLSL